MRIADQGMLTGGGVYHEGTVRSVMSMLLRRHHEARHCDNLSSLMEGVVTERRLVWTRLWNALQRWENGRSKKTEPGSDQDPFFGTDSEPGSEIGLKNGSWIRFGLDKTDPCRILVPTWIRKNGSLSYPQCLVSNYKNDISKSK